MAQKYPKRANGLMNWSDSTWSPTDEHDGDEAPPAAADDVDFTVNSTSVVLNEDTEALASFEIAGGSLTLDGDRTIDSPLVLSGGILNMATFKLTLSKGSTFSQTGGTFTSSGDWQGSIDVNGATLANVTATNLTRVYHGKDGGGNTKLFFVRPHGPLGVGGLTRRLA